MTIGYSGKSLARKLGLKPGLTLLAIGAPAGYEALLGQEGATVDILHAEKPLPHGPMADIVHLFASDRASLAAATSAIDQVKSGGMLWVSWPKKASPLFRDLTEDGLREILLPTGWVDVKVAAVDQDWSGLKFLKRRS